MSDNTIQANKHQKYYKFGLYMVILVLINIVSLSLFKRVDLTANDLYSLSDASKKVVSTLNEPLTINVFFTQNLPAPYNNIELYLHDLLEEYEIYSNDNLSYRFYDVTAQEGDVTEEAQGNRKIAQSYGIHPVNVGKLSQDETKIQRAYMGIVLVHGDVIEKIPAVQSTEGLEYKITSAIQKMNNKISALVNLPEKIKVHLILSSSISTIAKMVNLKGMEGLKGQVRDVVAKLNDKTYGQLEFKHIDPTMGEGTPELLKNFERFGLQWNAIQTKEGTTIPAGKAITAIGMSYRGKTIERNLLGRKLALTQRGPEEQYVISSTQEIETFINENIDNMIDVNEDIGFLASHGSLPLSVNVPPQMRMMQQQMPQALDDFNKLISSEYSVKEVKLEDGIPDSIDTLIIAGPKENFNDYELYQIDQFLMKGKSLAFFIDAFNEIQPRGQQRGQFQQPVYLPINTGLDKLLNHYGLKIKKSYLMDESCFMNRGRTGDEMKIYPAPSIKNEKINHDLAFLENIKQLGAYKISPLEADDAKIKAADLKLNLLFSSSDRSWEMKGRINLMPFMIQPPKDEKEMKSMPLGYLLEGEFPSYFADKAVPEKPKKEEKKEDEPAAPGAIKDVTPKAKKAVAQKPVKPSAVKGEQEIIRKGRSGKIFLVGCSEMLKGQLMKIMKTREDSYSPTEAFLINSLDYLNNREDIAVMRSKNQKFNPLSESKPFTRTLVKWFNILGLPLLFIIMGIFLWIKRMARKRRIQMMFSKANTPAKI